MNSTYALILPRLPEGLNVLKYALSLTGIMAVIWLLLSGQLTHAILVPLGAVSVALTVYLAYRMRILDREGHPIHLMIPIVKYLPWLLKEVVKANLVVARHIVLGRKSLSPRICRLDTTQETDLGRVFLANSITLTPGTVAVYVREREVWFYALTEELEQGVLSGEMDRRVTRLEGDP
ncbi:cation transporter [Halomonas sp. DQ26W]|uniref:Na+/H+ antiporter subunit E n=1 Tax=Halomonas sp. DQ26W TaxID=2282311 RepID=UPI000DF7FE35|nr:Na+/H+ antiporter subunit E [Halomonas sp. DQ26W]RDB43505.1 cation transporter [Halomonas sp. DQ26W]